MFKLTEDEKAIRDYSKTLNINNSEMEICGDIKDQKNSNEPIKFSSMDYMRQINDKKLIKALAKKFSIKNAYKHQNIAELLPELSAEEVATSNVFLAMMEQGDDTQVVLLIKAS